MIAANNKKVKIRSYGESIFYDKDGRQLVKPYFTGDQVSVKGIGKCNNVGCRKAAAYYVVFSNVAPNCLITVCQKHAKKITVDDVKNSKNVMNIAKAVDKVFGNTDSMMLKVNIHSARSR